MEGNSFEICNKKTMETYTVFPNSDFSSFSIGRKDAADDISLDNLLAHCEITEISEDVAEAGFDECIFPEYFAPHVSADTLIDYINDRKDTITNFLFSSNEEELCRLAEKRPDLYGEDYCGEMYEDSVRVIERSIIKDSNTYKVASISIEVLDIEIAHLKLAKAGYEIEITVDKQIDGEKGQVLKKACEKIMTDIAAKSFEMKMTTNDTKDLVER